MDLLETFIINAAAESHYSSPRLPQFQRTMQDIQARFGDFPNIPGYDDLKTITQPYLRVLRRREASSAEAGKASHCIATAVRAFVQQNDLWPQTRAGFAARPPDSHFVAADILFCHPVSTGTARKTLTKNELKILLD